MLRHALFLLIACIPCITCQLIIGTCPRMNRFVKDLDYERYSGEWYVIAQDKLAHRMRAVKCQRVTYTPKGIGMTYSYNVTNEDATHVRILMPQFY
ncbi:hypothetical protein TNIN_190951 [Trichonephila inaurata madagascariensis]|uniref:Lipocalin/cytosolic fatty-acid binding domain-containing protein n=1 Tax=Trichonephila inaurata madagascariensis TaxID=2747483 RepID=A0A8X6M8F0_9ARAC|nr:hypothetical protein TNIN_190951 [Trichonephila inaurata madagascariensis]